MTTQDPKKSDFQDISVEEKLRSLYEMQAIDAKIDEIRTLRGELPLEVQDLADEIAGLETRIENLNNELTEFSDLISRKKQEIKETGLLIKKYEAQQVNVRNSREYDSLSKEIEFQTLEIELREKQIKELAVEVTEKEALIENSKAVFAEKQVDLEAKKEELDEIISETQKDEENLLEKSESFKIKIEDRLLSAYAKIRKNARNGLAVVTVGRDACGGCFNKIPPQRQVDIRTRKKIIVCEYCGRILVDRYICDYDHSLEEADKAAAAAKPKRRSRRKEQAE